ncbi:MAG: hypothetical protein IT305_22870 [Chloroflexi bacterium]|nr:hypothetical protein [Chloroflexota bacterium]
MPQSPASFGTPTLSYQPPPENVRVSTRRSPSQDATIPVIVMVRVHGLVWMTRTLVPGASAGPIPGGGIPISQPAEGG